MYHDNTRVTVCQTADAAADLADELNRRYAHNPDVSYGAATDTLGERRVHEVWQTSRLPRPELD